MQKFVKKTWCAICPVKRKCLAFAMDTYEEFGVWGGMTEAERKRLREIYPGVENWKQLLGA